MASVAMDESLTSSEVAASAGVGTRYISHLIEEDILPDELYTRDTKRRFKPSAAAFAAFDYEVSTVLTADMRRKVLRALLDKYRDLADSNTLQYKHSQNLNITLGPIKVYLREAFKKVKLNLKSLEEAKVMVVRDEEILSGTPVIRGTRIPVYDIAAAAEKGISIERILEAYSDLTPRQIELARLWAAANPPMGRPRKVIGPADPATVTVKRVVRRGSEIHSRARK